MAAVHIHSLIQRDVRSYFGVHLSKCMNGAQRYLGVVLVVCVCSCVLESLLPSHISFESYVYSGALSVAECRRAVAPNVCGQFDLVHLLLTRRLRRPVLEVLLSCSPSIKRTFRRCGGRKVRARG